jgi:N-methylhydantoinase A/oxoprolinase/acetone carboxylase beta subunit
LIVTNYIKKINDEDIKAVAICFLHSYVNPEHELKALELIREKVLESCDFKATIPMQGKTNSLNVSAAVSAIVFERLRQIQELK